MSLADRIPSVRKGPAQQTIAGIERESLEGVLWALPYLAVFSVFLLWPLIKGLYMSFHDWDPLTPANSTWIGMENYVQLFGDPFFWNSLGNTIFFVALTVPAIVVVGLALALGVNRARFGKGTLRTIYFSPYILTVSVVAIVWLEVLAGDFGPLNYYLGAIIDDPPNYLGSQFWAMPALSMTTVWWGIGFNFIIFLAARQNVPERLYEAARLDGATSWRAFRDITLPQMRNALLFVVIIQFILQFQVFAQPYVMTSGGPSRATETLVMYLYESAFNQRAYGYAAAMGYVLFIVLIGVSMVNYYVLGGDVNE
ncbi:carbohydrate ABC transporter permease [Haloferax sp. DFSO52]|uniref:carbohydrate ABC transporter permease n=1 Tax=Haloferax sp. DFSO52 TaxID=3388505 RepID=UPI003A85D535